MRTVFLRLLGHEPDVGYVAHRGYIKRAVGFAEIDGLAEHTSIAAIGNYGFGVAGLTVWTPHAAGSTDHRRHGGVDDHIAGYM